MNWRLGSKGELTNQLATIEMEEQTHYEGRRSNKGYRRREKKEEACSKKFKNIMKIANKHSKSSSLTLWVTFMIRPTYSYVHHYVDRS